MKKSLDVLILFILVIARVRIDTLADTVLPQRHEDVRRLVGGWWPTASLDLLADWLSDPVTLVLISIAFGLTALYFITDAGRSFLGKRSTYWLKLGLIYAIVLILVFGRTFLLIGLRHITGPAAYTHDGGVIQTESTIEYFLAGKSPYLEDYLNTPMAAWGIEFRTALYHYPYLPWTFVFSTPFYWFGHALLGWFDQRFVYLLLFALTLVLTQTLAPTRPEKLLAVMLLGLNPILASDVIFGQNDSFILFWIILALWLLQWGQQAGRQKWGMWLGSLAFGLACASKPTAWFLAPFWFLFLLRDAWGNRFLPPRRQWWFLLKTLIQRAWPTLAAMLLVIGPWFVWSPEAMYDDVWRWSAGTAAQTYQIRGWGLSNFILAFQLVPDRLAYWPFWLTELAVAAPLLLLLLWRQSGYNTMGTMLYGYVVLLFAFFYMSRFLNENYLGYLAALLSLALVIDSSQRDPQMNPGGHR
ncbi:MAG: hypothetical protein JW953_15665 [Anaerolineae bacterium]|nr:hypothetical protein [Anaerolineae bacterium]